MATETVGRQSSALEHIGDWAANVSQINVCARKSVLSAEPTVARKQLTHIYKRSNHAPSWALHLILLAPI